MPEVPVLHDEQPVKSKVAGGREKSLGVRRSRQAAKKKKGRRDKPCSQQHAAKTTISAILLTPQPHLIPSNSPHHHHLPLYTDSTPHFLHPHNVPPLQHPHFHPSLPPGKTLPATLAHHHPPRNKSSRARDRLHPRRGGIRRWTQADTDGKGKTSPYDMRQSHAVMGSAS